MRKLFASAPHVPGTIGRNPYQVARGERDTYQGGVFGDDEGERIKSKEGKGEEGRERKV